LPAAAFLAADFTIGLLAGVISPDSDSLSFADSMTDCIFFGTFARKSYPVSNLKNYSSANISRASITHLQ
jgi:hypothetical protein